MAKETAQQLVDLNTLAQLFNRAVEERSERSVAAPAAAAAVAPEVTIAINSFMKTQLDLRVLPPK
jgi:hypothetical protein